MTCEHHRIGIVHPGEMGTFVAAQLRNSGCDVYWVSEGRSARTCRRAADQGLHRLATWSELTRTCSMIVSVCPPAHALDTARRALAEGFAGIYLDANAINPAHSQTIGQMLEQAGMTYIDGSIIGGPAWNQGTTRLYLSGPAATGAASRIRSGPLKVHVLGEQIGEASALKMCYAARTKGIAALLGGILALAEAHGVREALEQEWSQQTPQTNDAASTVTAVTAKAWRFVGEMAEIEQTFSEAGLPGGFHQAAGEIYKRMSCFKDAPEQPALADVIAALLSKP